MKKIIIVLIVVLILVGISCDIVTPESQAGINFSRYRAATSEWPYA